MDSARVQRHSYSDLDLGGTIEHSNAVRYREAHQSLTEGDTSSLLQMLADDVEWWSVGAAKPLVGKHAVAAWLGGLSEFEISSELHDLFANDEHLVALIHAKAHRAGADLDYSVAEVCHFDDSGMMTKRQVFAADTEPIRSFFV